MDKIVIEGAPPYDGEYEFEFGSFTTREMHRIKKLTGLVAIDFEDAFLKRDPDLFLGLAVEAMERNGKAVVEDVLWDAPIGSLRLVMGEEEEESPPEETQKTPSDLLEPNVTPSASSGSDSSADLDHSENGQSSTGHHALPTSAISDQEISAA